MRYAKSNLGLSDFDFSGAGGQGHAEAAGTAKLGEIFGTYRRNAPDYGAQQQAGIANRSAIKQAGIAQNAYTEATQITADATVKAAKLRADAAKRAAQKQAQGSILGSGLGAIASIGVGLLSDERTKNTIETLDEALTTLRQLKPVTFYYNEEYSSSPERLHYGFIAQDYAKVMPDATYFDDSIGKMCIDTGELISLLVRAVQQLETKVTRLEAANALAGVK